MQARSRLRDSVSLRDGCDTGAVAPDYGVGQLSAAIHCAATESSTRQCRRAVTLYGRRIALRGKSGRFRVS
jgi:hypothetical protein